MKFYKIIFFISVLILVGACGGANKKEHFHSELHSVINNAILEVDTIINYDLDNISSEGTEAIVKYKDGKIEESQINVYGETGQIKINYLFKDDTIKVIEKDFYYKTNLANVRFEDDIILNRTLNYTMDLNGSLHSIVNEERFDIYTDFKKVVPFVLRKNN